MLRALSPWFYLFISLCFCSLTNAEDTIVPAPQEEHTEVEMTDLETDLEKSFKHNKETKEEQERIEKIKEKIFNPNTPPSLMDIHESLSADIVGFSDSIDTFFVNERIIDGRNRTNLRVLSSASSIEREGTVSDVDFRFRFRLPRLENKLQVEVDNLNNTVGENESVASSNTNQTRQNQRQDTTAGLSFFKDVLGVRSKLTLGFIFRDTAPYGNFRLSKNIQFTENDNLMLISDVFGDTEDRTGHRGTIYFDHKISQNWLFRIFNESLYRNEFHTFETGHGLTFYQVINDRSSLAYTASVTSINPQTAHSFYVVSYDLFPSYRYRIYKNHAFFDVIPRLSFPKIYDFQTNWSITLRLEIIFGSI
jgi:hypothetical protein